DKNIEALLIMIMNVDQFIQSSPTSFEFILILDSSRVDRFLDLYFLGELTQVFEQRFAVAWINIVADDIGDSFLNNDFFISRQQRFDLLQKCFGDNRFSQDKSYSQDVAQPIERLHIARNCGTEDHRCVATGIA